MSEQQISDCVKSTKVYTIIHILLRKTFTTTKNLNTVRTSTKMLKGLYCTENWLGQIIMLKFFVQEIHFLLQLEISQSGNIKKGLGGTIWHRQPLI